MNPKDYNTAKMLKKRLLEVTEILDFRVFGSRVKDVQHEYSDLDVYIEVEHLDREVEDKILDIVWEIGFENFVLNSPFVCSKDEVENKPLRSSSILKSIKAEVVRV